jgi:small subunit ribosomal protein S17
MNEDEKKDAVEENGQDEGAEAAGPDAAEETSDVTPSDDSSSTPPAEEAAEADDSSSEEGEKAEAPAAEPSEEDQLPWKEKRRLERSRRPHEARPQLSPEERAAERSAERKRKAAERRKGRAAAKAKHTAGTGTPPAERDAVAAKIRQGVVVSDKGQKSITVQVDIVRRHPTYEKVVRNTRTLHAHDERDEAGEGDTVRVVETRPLSKTKRWRLVEIVEKAR